MIEFPACAKLVYICGIYRSICGSIPAFVASGLRRILSIIVGMFHNDILQLICLHLAVLFLGKNHHSSFV